MINDCKNDSNNSNNNTKNNSPCRPRARRRRGACAWAADASVRCGRGRRPWARPRRVLLGRIGMATGLSMFWHTGDLSSMAVRRRRSQRLMTGCVLWKEFRNILNDNNDTDNDNDNNNNHHNHNHNDNTSMINNNNSNVTSQLTLTVLVTRTRPSSEPTLAAATSLLLLRTYYCYYYC